MTAAESGFPASEKVNLETGKIHWKELQRFFAAGKTIYVAGALDLVDVACQISQDNTFLIQQLLETKGMAPVTDEQARKWFERDAQMWAVVAKPWVLVQPMEDKRDLSAAKN